MVMENERIRTLSRLSGVAVPLGALRTEQSPAVGEFCSLVPFAGWARQAGLGVIQLLPVLDTGTQSSPYSSLSAFALHPLYISIPQVDTFSDLYGRNANFTALYDAFVRKHKDAVRFDYAGLNADKHYLLEILYRFASLTLDDDAAFRTWVDGQSWLPAYCVYKSLKNAYMQSTWKGWGKKDRKITPEEITRRWNDDGLHDELYFFAWEQYVAHRQFAAAADAVRAAGIILKGDLPILINDDSCDAWSRPDLFNQKLRAGSPPDGSNPSGQNWGFPTYDWKCHAADGFAWWKLRLKTAERFYGAYRLDHILGFFRIWAVPEGEDTAELGHAEPCATLSRKEILMAGFDADRLRWLSEPHIPTDAVRPFVPTDEEAAAVMAQFCERIGDEDLWRFKDSITSAQDIFRTVIRTTADDKAQGEIKRVLARWLKNRTLVAVRKDAFVPLWQYPGTQAWHSLNNDEKSRLNALFAALNAKNERRWQAQAEQIFGALIPSTTMIPCGEDLGVGLVCLAPVMEKYGILHLNVVRWTRDWGADGQPYIPFEDYCPLGVTTTSVHDSSTVRQWWDEERDSVRAFEKSFAPKPEPAADGSAEIPAQSDKEFSPEAAAFVLKTAARTAGAWFINPLQDWLALDNAYWQDDPANERVNVPGTVSPFNWTYRMSATVETLAKDKALARHIKAIAQAHDRQGESQTPQARG
ncbi:MAG: 4-alpha-glucanotransferase [Treponemataceae bacterium]|nr:4-alpha-glucanotransferase [Treponemataceae bacterium]